MPDTDLPAVVPPKPRRAGGSRARVDRKLRGQPLMEVDDDYLKKLGDADERMLPPTLRIFGRWLAEKTKRPIAEQLAKLFDVTGETWTLPKLNELKQMGAFREYVLVMHERGLRAAKERMGEIAYDAVEGLAEGIADTRGMKEWATMSKLTGQVLERAMPRREDLALQNTNVTIVLTEKQLAHYSMPEVETSWEVVDGESDGQKKDI